MASKITGVSIIYSAVCSGADQRTQLRVTGLCEGNSPVTSDFHSQSASDAENDSIWWRHHDDTAILTNLYQLLHMAFSQLDAEETSNSHTRRWEISLTEPQQKKFNNECVRKHPTGIIVELFLEALLLDMQ